MARAGARSQSALSDLASFVRLSRLYNAVLPTIGIIVGFVATGGEQQVRLLVALLVGILLHSAITLWNDVVDERVDSLNNIDRVRSLRRSGKLHIVYAAVIGCVVLAAMLCLWLPAATVACFAAVMMLAWLYNAPPVQGAYRPIASIIILSLTYGALPVVIGATLGHDFASWIWWLAVAWGIGRGSLSIMKDYKDALGDAQAGKKTFLLVYGSTWTARVSFVGATLAFSIILVLMGLHGNRIVGLLLLAVALWLLNERAKLSGATNYQQQDKIFHDCLTYQIVFDALVVLCLHR